MARTTEDWTTLRRKVDDLCCARNSRSTGIPTPSIGPGVAFINRWPRDWSLEPDDNAFSSTRPV